MITKKVWFAMVAALTGGTCVLLSMLNGFIPQLEDLADPLGRPSDLSRQVIHSASEFDRLTSVLVPKHRDLGQRIQTLHTVADDLDGIVGEAGDLVPAAHTVNVDTGSVQGVATPLPPLIDKVTGRAKQATPQVDDLSSAVGSVTAKLEAINTGLVGIHGDLDALGPRADLIVAVLGKIESESARVKPIAPLLSLLGSGNHSSSSGITGTPPTTVPPFLGLLGLGK